MAQVLAKACTVPGCPELATARGRCATHSADRERGTTKARGYGHSWTRFRALILKRHPLCQVCGEAPASEVHHKIKIKVRPDLRLSADNALALCPPCHRRNFTNKGM